MASQDLAVEVDAPSPHGEPGEDDAARPNLLQQEPAQPDRPIPWSVRVRVGFVREFLLLYARCLGMSGLYRLGRIFGFCEYLVDHRRRGRVHRKLTSLFGDEMPKPLRRRHVQRYFMRVRCDKMFYTIMDRIPRGKLLNRIKIKNKHYADDALTRGKGLYVALCHYGSHHVAGLMMALMGYKIAGVRDAKESHVRRYIYQKYRETWPEVAEMKLVYSNKFPRVQYRHMQANGIVASLLDVDRRRGDHLKTRKIDFFGKPRHFLCGPIQMAVRCGATVIQGFVVSRKDFYYQLIATPPLIDPDKASALSEDEMLEIVMPCYAQNVEAFVREHPDHVMNI